MTDLVTQTADQRIVTGVPSSLRWTHVDEWGDETPADGAVTVTVARADGTAVVTGQAATLESGTTGTYTRALTPAQVGGLDVLTAVWSDAGTVVATTTVEVVGRFSCTVAELRASHPAFQSQSQTYTARALATWRDLAEREAEEICGRSFVPRYRRVTLDGSGDTMLRLPDPHIRAVTEVIEDGTAWTAGQLDDLVIYSAGRLERTSGAVWPAGRENLTVAYQHGLDAPPPEVRWAEMLRAQEMALAAGPHGTGIPRRATSMTTDGTTVQLGRATKHTTGNPDVDAVYARWSLRAGAGDSGDDLVPVSRQIDYNPQALSLFHGGRR